MSGELRVLLLIGPILASIYVLQRIYRTKMRIADAIFWIVISFFLIILGLFPGLLTSISHMLAIQSPSNLVFLVFIFILLAKCFSMSLQISLLESKMQTLAQKLALREMDGQKAYSNNIDPSVPSSPEATSANPKMKPTSFEA